MCLKYKLLNYEYEYFNTILIIFVFDWQLHRIDLEILK